MSVPALHRESVVLPEQMSASVAQGTPLFLGELVAGEVLFPRSICWIVIYITALIISVRR